MFRSKVASIAFLSAFLLWRNLNPADVFALEGSPSGDFFPDAICKIEYVMNVSPAEEICTGTLVEKNKILTAGHCEIEAQQFANKNNWKIVNRIASCEQGKVTASITKTSTPKYLDLGTDNDRAILTLSNKLDIKPVRISFDEKEVLSLLSNPSTCSLFGYGYKDDVLGKPSSVILKLSDDINSPVDVSDSIIWMDHSTSAEPGDSGGPLLCKSPQGEWVQVGISVTPFSQEQLLLHNVDWLKKNLASHWALFSDS